MKHRVVLDTTDTFKSNATPLWGWTNNIIVITQVQTVQFIIDNLDSGLEYWAAVQICNRELYIAKVSPNGSKFLSNFTNRVSIRFKSANIHETIMPKLMVSCFIFFLQNTWTCIPFKVALVIDVLQRLIPLAQLRQYADSHYSPPPPGRWSEHSLKVLHTHYQQLFAKYSIMLFPIIEGLIEKHLTVL